MAKRTNKYGMIYFEQGDFTNAQYELQRWETLDAQLEALFSIMGNGVLTGWTISEIKAGGLSCAVLPGSGHVGFVAVKSTANEFVPLTPNDTNYIYAQLTNDSYWTKNVAFVSFVDQLDEDTDKNLYLGSVETNENGIVSIDTSGRTELGFLALINSAIANHKHNGAEGNPDPVDLSKEVQGILGQEHLPNMDASLIQTGTIDTDRLPLIDHVTGLTNQGLLTHAQLDSYIETLSLDNQSLMGEVSTTNLLELILALKHVYPDIDEFLVNEIAFIPGISPDDYIDTVNTTAIVDTRPYSQGGQHTISGTAEEGFQVYTRSWNTKNSFESGTLDDTIVNGNTVILDTTVNELSIDEFNDINQWVISTQDLSSINSQLSLDSENYVNAPTSAKLTIGSESVEVQLLVEKTFDAQDWSGYDFLSFYLYTENVQHGDLFFYLRDADFGEQDSSKLVLKRNSPTINNDTLINGWQEITIDLRYFQRGNIDTIGFYVSTQEGWNTSKGFDLNIDSVKLSAGNLYEEDGYIRVIYGSDLFSSFWRLRWDSIVPSDVLSSGVNLQARTRVANNEIDLADAPWSSYLAVSGSNIQLPIAGALYKYIEIEMHFTASINQKRSAVVNSIYLDYYVVDVNNSFDFTSQDDWETGTRFNIDTETTPGSILIRETDDVGDTIYGTKGYAKQINDSLQEVYGITGSLFPRSTDQVVASESPSLGLVTAVARGNNGNIWIVDTDNNRVFEVNKAGDLIRGFQGSFINVPIDNYGVEDGGPGSNELVETSTEESEDSTTDFEVLHSLYNPEEGSLYIVFNQDIENIYDSAATFDITKIYIKTGGHKIWLNESTAELLGVDEEGYNRWGGISSESEAGTFIGQFKFTSHILKITVTGADKTLLDYMVNQEQPSIIIYTPKKQERLNGNVTARFLVYNFELGTQSGENGIRVTLDGTPQTIYSDRITLSGLSNGEHILVAQLEKADGSVHSNIEAIANSSFVVWQNTYTQPYLTLKNPRTNQIYSSNPVTIEFEIENFPIIPSGQHIKYQVDSEVAEDHYSTDPIVLENLEVGKHTIALWTVDERGDILSYDYGRVEADFIVGLNSNATTKLYLGADSIASSSGSAIQTLTNLYVDVENIRFINMYSPIDIQMIPAEASVNNDGLPTILVSKLRSQSGTQYLSGADAETEIVNRAAQSAGAEDAGETITLNPVYEGIETSQLIYGSKYLDGHSVIQLNMDGDVIFSNNAAVFALTKDNAKESLGSAEKIGDSELLIGDSVNQRAMVINTDLTTQVPQIVWQYNSDRLVPDFHLNIQDERRISIYDGSVSEALSYIRQGMNVIWTNESSVPISIYSGSTAYTLFNLNPNLNLYGDVFSSSVLQPGDSYTFKFEEEGEYPWFVYPSIITATIQVNKQRISSQDEYLILESDGLESPFSSRLIKVDSWGNVVWSFGEGYLVKPRDARPMLNNRVLIST
jgi:hypothetical protein